MKPSSTPARFGRKHTLAALGLLALGIAAAARGLVASQPRAPVALPAADASDFRSDAPVRSLISAQPFFLEQGFDHVWRAEQPRFDAGWLLVLEVDARLVEPRQLEEPVLCAGAQTLERINHGAGSGRVIAILPSPRAGPAGLEVDLAHTPFWFADPALPERLDAAALGTELERALAAGARPFARAAVDAARARAGAPLWLRSRSELDEHAALMILEHSPQEFDLGSGMLAPRVR